MSLCDSVTASKKDFNSTISCFCYNVDLLNINYTHPKPCLISVDINVDMDEVLKRIQSSRNVVGVMVINNEVRDTDSLKYT